MKVTIIYDNETDNKDLVSDWGFSCLIEFEDKRTILFDTGAKGEILEENMEKLGIDINDIDEIFISHNHWDHVGGLPDILKNNEIVTYFPSFCEKLDKILMRVSLILIFLVPVENWI